LYSRTRTWLLGAALTVLAIAFAAAFGASNAAAASQHASTKVHKITSCGYTASVSGTYELTKSLTDSGSGDCITLDANNVTLYLDGHTITGTGTDTCVYVEGGGTSLSTNETVIGGTKAKPTKTATLTNCKYGLYVYWTSGTKASHLNIVSPTSDGVYEYYAGGMMLSNINVPLHANTAYGFYLEYGADNVVTKSTVDNNGSDYGFYAYYEVGDTFTQDAVKDTYSNSGSGTGFYDEYSSRNIYSHDTSKGQYDGFYVYAYGYGPVTLSYDTATGRSSNINSYGFYVYEAYQEADSASPFHTLVSHDKATGFQYGYDDESNDSYAQAEKWIDNTADNYSEYGFYIDYTTDYTMIGNVADGNTGTKKYNGSSTTYGFYLDDPYSYEPFAKFANNQAYDSQYGFYSDEYMVGGKGNVAKRNKYNSYDVEITG